jgi:hypothetical protein
LLPVAARADLRIGTFDVDRGGIGSLMSDDREWARAAIDTSFEGVTIAAVSVLTEAFIDTLDLLWLDAVAASEEAIAPLSTAEQTLLGQFVTAGGGVIIFTDTDWFDTANQSLLAPFGLIAAGSLVGDRHVTVTDAHATPVTDSFFGLVEGYWTGWPGWYTDLGDHAMSLATLDDNGQTHLAFIEREVLGPAAGGAVFMADHRTRSLALMLNSILAVTPAAVPTAVGADDVLATGRLASIYPNPFNPHTTISFSMRRSCWADVSVYDLSGRRVADLASKDFAAGAHTLAWNGRDKHGRAVSSGPYIVRLEAEGRVASKKVMLVR